MYCNRHGSTWFCRQGAAHIWLQAWVLVLWDLGGQSCPECHAKLSRQEASADVHTTEVALSRTMHTTDIRLNAQLLRNMAKLHAGLQMIGEEAQRANAKH